MKTLLLIVVLLVLVSAVWAQAPSAANDPMGGQALTRWHDGIHYLGLACGVLALGAVIVGGVLFFGFELLGRKYNFPARKKTRTLHIALGMTAIGLGTVHFVVRLVQLGHFQFSTSPPMLAQACFLLVLLTGILRHWTPKALRKHWKVFPWLHRAVVVGALYYLTRHSLYQYHKFMGTGR